MFQFQTIEQFFRCTGYYEIACTVMAHLTASDAGALLASLRIKPSPHMAETFLQPLRDFDHTLQSFQPWFSDKCHILIIGPDTIRLMERIFRADAYYKEDRSHKQQLEVCVFAIPRNFENSVNEIQRLRERWHDRSFSMQERAKAWMTGKELLENDLIRQIISPCQSAEKHPGERLDIKVFDIFSTDTHRCFHTPYLVGLEFMGMIFGIEWNMKEPTSKDNCWKARHGCPYIEAADPCELKEAPEDRRRRRKPASLVFHSEYPDWDPQSTVSIPVTCKHTHTAH